MRATRAQRALLDSWRQELEVGMGRSLSPLDRRLRARHLNTWIRAALDGALELPALQADSDHERWAGYATLLHALILRLEAQGQARQARYDALRKACGDATSPRARHSLMAAYLREEADSWLGAWGDRKALKRRLDLAALRERVDEAREQELIGVELAMAGATHFWLKALHKPGASIGAVLDAFDEAAPFELWLRAIRVSLRWSFRFKAASLLARLVQAPLLVSRARLQVPGIQAQVRDAQEHPWVRRALLAFLARAYPDSAMRIAQEALQESGSVLESAFLFRVLVLELYSRDAAENRAHAAIVLEHWARVDASEHLRLRLAEYLARLNPEQRGLVDALYRRLLPGVHADPSVAVRVRGTKSVGQLMRACLASEVGSKLAAKNAGPFAYRYAALLEAVLHNDNECEVLATAAREMAKTVHQLSSHAQLESHPAMIQAFYDALSRLRARPGLTAQLEEGAAAAQEEISLTMDATAREALGRLRHHLRTMKVGERRSIDRSGAFSQLSGAMLGRILAHLTRDDWGLYIESRSTSLLLQRGDRKVMRPWRIWHEIRHPLPNKRKGFVHTSGRMIKGELRAHPRRLDEATTTLVPGERVSIPQDQGCARHLPFVDDLIGRPLLGPTTKVRIFSSLGVSSVQVRAGGFYRFLLQLRLQRDYAKLASLRRTSLLSDDPVEQRRYTETLARVYGIEVSFHPYRARLPISKRTAALFAQRTAAPEPSNPENPAVRMGCLGLVPMGFTGADGSAPMGASGFDLWGLSEVAPLGAQEWMTRHVDYLLSSHGNDQLALSIFVTLVFSLFLIHAFVRRSRIRRARAAIPLSIGGWGTRGKSGTERLKAAMFHGMGYRVFSKTTGCEAMFVHSVAGGTLSEIFVFRPYGKATIWEQRDLLELSSKLPTDVFLWECMALNPTYVSLLQHSWMRDDVATITNAYPDHEDIQGPAGEDVARVITRFVPQKSVVVSSEVNFAPLFRDTAAQQESRYVEVPEGAEMQFGQDLLDLFPYQEHPRNIALVAQVGEEMGIDRDLSVYNMAKFVVPDLGVLKSYGDALVRGRRLRFINGCSANERAGFMSNWRRTGCDALDADDEPGKMLALVVNNRADRISRSEVFSKIMVKDAGCDRFILIGTNLGGLRSFLDGALKEFLAEILPTLDPSKGKNCMVRFEALMKRHRAPRPERLAMTERLRIYARGIGRELSAEALALLEPELDQMLRQARECSLQVDQLKEKLKAQGSLAVELSNAIQQGELFQLEQSNTPECFDAPEVDELVDGYFHQLARWLVVHRLRLQLRELVARPESAARASFFKDFETGYRSLFDDSLVQVDDAGAKGDELLEICARSVPPGADLTLMGSQNIKGTGLDFVYRWIALDLVQGWIKKIRSASVGQREEGYKQLEGFADHGRMDLALLEASLAAMETTTPDERATVQRIQDKVSAQSAALAKRKGGAQRSMWAPLLSLIEAGVEFLDGARRYHQSQSLKRDLIAGRVSHERATVEMREIYARAKGGWLGR